VLKIYRDPRSLDGADAGSALLAKHGLVYRRVSPPECAEIEPALQRTSNTLAGGLAEHAAATPLATRQREVLSALLVP
jgi:hypothetical protein